MKNIKIALDIDDVLAAFAFKVHDVFNKAEGLGKHIEPHDHWNQTGLTGRLMVIPDENGNFKSYTEDYLSKCENNKAFWAGLPVLSLPCDIDFEVACYITSSPQNMVSIRRKWLEDNGFPKAPVVHCKEKQTTMKRLGIDVLVDDKLSTVMNVNRTEDLLGIHFQPWYCNVESPFTIKSLKDVKSFIEKMWVHKNDLWKHNLEQK